MSATSGSGDLLDDLRGHLVDRGIFRMPQTANPGDTVHPLYLEPKRGAIAPGEEVGNNDVDQVTVASARLGTEIRVGPYESWYYKPCVEITYRCRRARDVRPLDDRLRGELEDRRDWTTSRGLYVIESGVFMPLARLGSDDRAFTFQAEYWFQLYTARGPRTGT